MVLPLFFLSLVLEFTNFFPNLDYINVWDEANYIHKGFLLLVEGQLPRLAGSPLSSLMYALAMLPVFESRNFFMLSNAIARIGLFTLIFWTVYLIAKEIKAYANPWILVAMIMIVPVVVPMYQYPSDILFAGLAGLAFWQMLAFYNQRKIKHLAWASMLMGIATLARAEGLLLLGALFVATLMIVVPKIRWINKVLAVLLPFWVVVGGYVLVYGAVTGDFSTGLSERTFNNFESGHEFIYSQTGIFTPTVSARIEANQVFGTAEENNNSVFRAIRRNPVVYWQRVKMAFPAFLHFAIKAYGNKFILIFVWLSLRGFVELIRKRHVPLAVLGFLWFMPLGVAFLNTFFREGYFLMPFLIIFVFSSIGLSAILQNIEQPTEKIALLAASLLVLLVGAVLRNTSMLYRNALFIFGMFYLLIVKKNASNKQSWLSQAYWILLALTLIIRGGYPSPELPVYGKSDIERSVHFLQDRFPEQTKVLAGAPANVWAARMHYSGINSYDIPEFIDERAFLDWMRVQEIKAIYIDQQFPEFYEVYVNALSGQGIDLMFTAQNSDIRIYSVLEDGG
jgi:hypothetical protein